MQNNPQTIAVSQLRVGLYIHLDLGWMDHPFTLSNFKLQDDAQIQTIKNIGLKTLRYDPSRSDCLPLSQNESQVGQPATEIAQPNQVEKSANLLLDETKKNRLNQLNRAINECEKKFIAASDIVKCVTHNIIQSPKISLEKASSLVNEMVDTALMEGDVAIHAMNGNRASDAHYQHPLNVTVLALMLAKTISISKEDARLLGMAAILHDIGKAEVSEAVLHKKTALSHAEQLHFQEHAQFGASMIKEAGLSPRIGKILLQHHEYADGSGYPQGLKAKQTDYLAQVIVLANAFDSLCNPFNTEVSKTPYEALKTMFALHRHKYNEDLLKLMIKTLGIYPPGSIVKLSNHQFATVISSNPNSPLKPYVQIHNPEKDTLIPIILDLREEAQLNITNCLRSSQLPPEILKLISPRKKVSYFMDEPMPKNDTND